MKYIEVTAWGNGKKHLLPLNKIVDFSFEDKYTTLSLSSSSYLNVIETKEQIEELLSWHGAKIVSTQLIDQYQEEYSATYEHGADFWADASNDNDLPF